MLVREMVHHLQKAASNPAQVDGPSTRDRLTSARGRCRRSSTRGLPCVSDRKQWLQPRKLSEPEAIAIHRRSPFGDRNSPTRRLRNPLHGSRTYGGRMSMSFEYRNISVLAMAVPVLPDRCSKV